MKPQLYMPSSQRDLFLDKHDFYMKQVKTRVLGNFKNIENEADKFAQEIYERIGSTHSDDEIDMADAAEIAEDRGHEFYMLLSDMRTQTTLGTMAALYHQWDKDVRGFLEDQLSNFYDPDKVTKFVWGCNINKVFEILEGFGWPIRQEKWFSLLNACRLIVNVYKHGKGSSLDELIRDYPQYLKGPVDDIPIASFLTIKFHEDLEVTEEEFDQIAGAIRQFWLDFPERQFPIADTGTDGN